MKKSSTKLYLLAPSLILIMITGLWGQLKSDIPQQQSSPQLKSVASSSWLDPQRFSMNHGFSVSLMTGRGLQAGATSLSVYTNQMRYLVTDNLILNSRIHLVQPGIMSSTQQTGQNLLIYYQAGMDWQPLKNLRIHLGISNLPRLQRYYYGNPMWYSAYPQGGRTLDPSTTMD